MANIPAINVIFAVLFGVSIFALVMSLGQRERVTLTDLEKLTGEAKVQRSTFDLIENRIKLSGFKMDVSQFILTSLSIGAALGFLMYILSNAFLAGLLGVAGGSLILWVYMGQIVDKAQQEYEYALPDVFAHFLWAIKLHNVHQLAVRDVAENGPLVCRADWNYIAVRIASDSQYGVLRQAFQDVARERSIMTLTKAFELIDIAIQKDRPLSDVLPGVVDNLRSRVAILKRSRTSLEEPMNNLAFVCAVPIVIVFLLRLVSPNYASAYGSLPGQLILLVCWSISIGAYYYGYKLISKISKEDTDFGGLASDYSGISISEDPAPPPA